MFARPFLLSRLIPTPKGDDFIVHWQHKLHDTLPFAARFVPTAAQGSDWADLQTQPKHDIRVLTLRYVWIFASAKRSNENKMISLYDDDHGDRCDKQCHRYENRKTAENKLIKMFGIISRYEATGGASRCRGSYPAEQPSSPATAVWGYARISVVIVKIFLAGHAGHTVCLFFFGGCNRGMVWRSFNFTSSKRSKASTKKPSKLQTKIRHPMLRWRGCIAGSPGYCQSLKSGFLCRLFPFLMRALNWLWFLTLSHRNDSCYLS